MNKINISVNWMKGWGNSPRIEVKGITVPTWPDESTPIWEKSGGFHRAIIGPFVFYFYTDGKPTEGYGGRRFAGTFKDGTTFEYKGAWSSRAGCMNVSFKDHHIVDVSCGHIATGMLVEFVDEHWNFDSAIQLFGRQDGHDFIYEPNHLGYYKGDSEFTYPE